MEYLLWAFGIAIAFMFYIGLGFWIARLLKWDFYAIESLGPLFALWPIGVIIHGIGKFVKLINQMNNIRRPHD